MKKKLYLFMTAMATSALCIMNTEAQDNKELTIVYTTNSSGKLRSCNCPGDPYGGLSERVTLMKELRKKENPFLLVDAGDMVSLFGDFDRRAETVIRLMNVMKYDVAAVGGNEMYRGIIHAQKISSEAEFPLISTSIADTTGHKVFFKPYVTKKIGEVSVAIIAVCDSSCFILRYSDKYDFKVLPTSDTLQKILTDISPKCDFTIVLSQMSPGANKALLENFPEIDLIVEGYGNKRYDPPITASNGLIVSPGGRGQFVGLITIEKLPGTVRVKRSELIPVGDIPEGEKASKILQEYYSKIK